METMSDLWLPDGSPRWTPAESAIQVEALNAIESVEDQTSRFVAICAGESVAIEDLEISLVMARDLAESKIEPHHQASVQDFLDQIADIEAWWRASISEKSKGLLASNPESEN